MRMITLWEQRHRYIITAKPLMEPMLEDLAVYDVVPFYHTMFYHPSHLWGLSSIHLPPYYMKMVCEIFFFHLAHVDIQILFFLSFLTFLDFPS